MSQWTKRIREHKAWSMLTPLGSAIDKAESLPDLNQDEREALDRLRTVLAFCGKRIGATDPLTIVPTTLDAIEQFLSSQHSQVEAFLEDRSLGQLIGANANADGLLLQLGQVAGLCDSEELIEFVGAVSRYRSQIDDAAHEWSATVVKNSSELEQLTTSLDKGKRELASAIVKLRTQIDGERLKITAATTEFQRLFSEAQEARSNLFTETLRKTLSDQQGQFSAAQENRGTQFSSALNEMQKQIHDLTADYTKRLADQDTAFTKARDAFSLEVNNRIGALDSQYREKADEVLVEVEERKQEVEKLVGVIGSLGVTSGYQKTANTAKHSMWIWQGGAVTAMIAVIVFAWYAFVPAIQGEFHWSGFVARVFLTITVGVLAAYAAAQADRFFHMEKQHRRLALELAAIDPFIALLPLEEQQRFKLEIGRRSFGQENSNGDIPTVKSPATTLDLLIGSKDSQQALENLVQIMSKLKV